MGTLDLAHGLLAPGETTIQKRAPPIKCSCRQNGANAGRDLVCDWELRWPVSDAPGVHRS